MDGAVILDKPSGISSRTAAKRVAEIFGEKRFAHAGTLDVMAQGVLVVLLGYAVRLAEFLLSEDKEYRAQVLFGLTSDTLDAHGRVTPGRPLEMGDEELDSLITSFKGAHDQTAPVYSALKYKGKPMYSYAERGVQVPDKIRPVFIHEIRAVSMRLPESAFIEVHCSKGTYVRSLCRDLGEAAGADAIMGSLVRLRSGEFTLSSSHTLEELGRLAGAGTLGHALIAPAFLLEWMASVTLDESHRQAIVQGRLLEADLPESVSEGDKVRIFAGGEFAAIGKVSGGAVHPEKVFLKP